MFDSLPSWVYLVAGVTGLAMVVLLLRSLARSARSTLTARQISALSVVAGIGTFVGCVGVAHAMYDQLRAGGAGVVLAGAEAGIASLFLEGVVVVCASRARAHAAGSRAAKLDVGVVLAAAVISGLVSGLHAGWGTAGLLRFFVPLIAAVVWLGDVVHVLRTRARDDGEQLLRRVVDTVGRHSLATASGRAWRIRRADRALTRAMCSYSAGGGERDQLMTRLDEVHHRADLLAPMGRSPWRPVDVWPVPRPVPVLALESTPKAGPETTTTDSPRTPEAVPEDTPEDTVKDTFRDSPKRPSRTRPRTARRTTGKRPSRTRTDNELMTELRVLLTGTQDVTVRGAATHLGVGKDRAGDLLKRVNGH